MGRDHELRPLPREGVDPREQGHLPGGGEGRLRLVEQVEPLRGKAVERQREEALPVGLLVQRPAAVVVDEAAAGPP